MQADCSETGWLPHRELLLFGQRTSDIKQRLRVVGCDAHARRRPAISVAPKPSLSAASRPSASCANASSSSEFESLKSPRSSP